MIQYPLLVLVLPVVAYGLKEKGHILHNNIQLCVINDHTQRGKHH